MYSIKFRGKTHPITRGQFIAIALLVALYMILGAIGIYQFSGWLLTIFILLIASVTTINDTECAIIPHVPTRTMLAGVGLLAGFVHFWYHTFF